jgi:DtxR family Mn-dependent transcriptional regulator
MFEKETRLSDSLEDYLEIILALETQNKVARVKDISKEMDVLRGSVTSALKKLGEKGLINYEPYSFITLTPKGAAIAREITRRHEVIKDFLINVLQIDPDKAETNACRMEHIMDKASIDRLVQFIKYIQNSAKLDTDWIQSVENSRFKD